MSRFIIFGGNEFTLGFSLAGAKDIIEVNENTAEKEMKKILDEKIEGILVVDENTFDYFSERTRHIVEDSVTPVVVALSESAEQETIRRMIVKAIGVDILAKDET